MDAINVYCKPFGWASVTTKSLAEAMCWAGRGMQHSTNCATYISDGAKMEIILVKSTIMSSKQD